MRLTISATLEIVSFYEIHNSLSLHEDYYTDAAATSFHILFGRILQFNLLCRRLVSASHKFIGYNFKYFQGKRFGDKNGIECNFLYRQFYIIKFVI